MFTKRRIFCPLNLVFYLEAFGFKLLNIRYSAYIALHNSPVQGLSYVDGGEMLGQ